jgi:beta-lactamase superfamily II metal-dependent hydrolase
MHLSRWRLVLKIAALGIALAACSLVFWPPKQPRNDLRITFIDVGQADAILIQTPRGHAIMIDTGGRRESCRAILDSARYPSHRRDSADASAWRP